MYLVVTEERRMERSAEREEGTAAVPPGAPGDFPLRFGTITLHEGAVQVPDLDDVVIFFLQKFEMRSADVAVR